jgi:hypothetical protein
MVIEDCSSLPSNYGNIHVYSDASTGTTVLLLTVLMPCRLMNCYLRSFHLQRERMTVTRFTTVFSHHVYLPTSNNKTEAYNPFLAS